MNVGLIPQGAWLSCQALATANLMYTFICGELVKTSIKSIDNLSQCFLTSRILQID